MLDAARGGCGLATEAILAACAWLDARERYPRSFCVIDPGNEASLRVAHKLGYRHVQDSSLGGEPVGVFVRQR